MHNGQLQRRILPGERRNQSPVVKIRRSRADPSNKADMHFVNPHHRSYRVERCSMCLEVDGLIASEWSATRTLLHPWRVMSGLPVNREQLGSWGAEPRITSAKPTYHYRCLLDQFNGNFVPIDIGSAVTIHS